MQNFIQHGKTLSIPATADALSGQVVKIGAIIGVAASDAAIGETIDLTTEGVFELEKVAADAVAVGDAVYWRSSDGLVTGTASGNTKIGVAVTDAANPSGSVNVRLNGTF